MNPITTLLQELITTEQTLTQHTNKYSWLKGYGTGWQGSHYGMSQEEYDAAYDRCVALRGRIIALNREIARLRKIARPERGMSVLAHRGR